MDVRISIVSVFMTAALDLSEREVRAPHPPAPSSESLSPLLRSPLDRRESTTPSSQKVEGRGGGVARWRVEYETRGSSVRWPNATSPSVSRDNGEESAGLTRRPTLGMSLTGPIPLF